MGLFGKDPKVPNTISKKDANHYSKSWGAQIFTSDKSCDHAIKAKNLHNAQKGKRHWS